MFKNHFENKKEGGGYVKQTFCLVWPKLPYKIELTDDALVIDSVEYYSLCKDVKKILGIIVGLLKDRACVDNSSEAKRIKVDSYLLKK